MAASPLRPSASEDALAAPPHAPRDAAPPPGGGPAARRAVSIKTKLVLAVSLSMIAVLVGFSLALFASYERRAKEQIGRDQFALASVFATALDDKLTRALEEIDAVARVVPPEALLDADRAQAFLDWNVKQHPFFGSAMFLFSPNGLLIAEVPEAAPRAERRGRDFSSREYLKVTLATRRPHIGEPYFTSRPGHAPTLTMTAPVLGPGGELLGVVAGAVDLLRDDVLGRAVTLRNGNSGHFFVVGEDRRLVLHPDRSRILSQEIPPGANTLLDRALQGFEGSDEDVNSRGLHAITSFKRLRAKNWVVGVNYPIAEAYAPIERARRALLLFVLPCAALIVTAVVWYVMTVFMRPLLAFTAHVEAIGRKEGAARLLGFASTDEIGQLAQAFDRMVSDLDARKAEVEGERERLAVTLTSIGDAVVVADLQGVVVLVNRAAEALTGWASGDAVGRPLAQVFRAVDEGRHEPIPDPVTAVIASGATVALAAGSVLVSRGGDEVLVAGSCAPVRASDGEIIGAVLVFQDVTEKRALEEQRARADKLESVGLLAGGIAHDFNNLLAAILGNLSVARLEADRDGPFSELLADTEAAALRARDLTFQLLTFARGGEPIKKRVALAELVRTSASFAVRGSQVACEYDFPPDLLPVEVDAGQIGQVVHNLVLNAVQAMPGGGVIRLRARNLDVVGRRAGRQRIVRLRVTDQGEGIPAEVKHKIFDPYFTTKRRGMGLGLASAHSIVSRHGGRLDVESEPGKGSTFIVDLPAADGPVDAAAERAPVLAHRGRVLVMDDDDGVRKTCRRMLEELGVEAETACDGAEAVAAFAAAREERRPFDAVILDLTVPGAMGGKETLEHLLRLDPGVRAIVASGYSNDPVMAEFRSHGFAAVVAKPFRIEELGDALNAAVCQN